MPQENTFIATSCIMRGRLDATSDAPLGATSRACGISSIASFGLLAQFRGRVVELCSMLSALDMTSQLLHCNCFSVLDTVLQTWPDESASGPCLERSTDAPCWRGAGRPRLCTRPRPAA